MKHFLTVTMAIAGVTAHGQIALEHTYPNAGYFYNGGLSTGDGSLFLWDFEQAGTKYVKIDRASKLISLFDLDHEPYLDFSFASAPTTIGTPIIMYLSQHLFDLDDGFEYMYITSAGGWSATYTRVYDQDGAVLLNADSGSVWVQSTIPPQQYPISNTSEGTKLIISHGPDQSARVYSLPGTLTTEIHTGTQESVTSAPPNAIIYPDPAGDLVTIRYTGLVHEPVDQVLILDANGRTVRSESPGLSNGSIDVRTGDLAAGSYSVLLRTTRGSFPVGQFIKAP